MVHRVSACQDLGEKRDTRSLLLASMSSVNAEHPEGNAASLSVSIGIITDSPDHPENLAHFSVTTALTYCKTKILRPYLRFLSITGLRSFVNDGNDGFSLSGCFCCIYICVLMILILLGYALQYSSCFRRDRGFSYMLLASYSNGTTQEHDNLHDDICEESSMFSYGIPHLLHFVGYLHAFHVFRSSNDDQLPSLMESVFLTLTNLSDGFQSQKKLVRTLWIFVTVSLLWMVSSLITIAVLMGIGNIYFKWINQTNPITLLALKTLLVLSSLLHDVVQTTVISNYCLQAQLLTSYIHFLRAKLLQHSVMSTEWMRDMEEFKKLLNFLNSKLAPSVCIFTLLNVCRGITGIMFLFNFDMLEKNIWSTYWICVINIILWITLALAPFIQAARLTNSCTIVRGVGQELRVRPFPQRSMNSDSTKQLDSLMLYSSSLRFRAKLFGVPIRPSYLFFLLTVVATIVIVLGQLHYLK